MTIALSRLPLPLLSALSCATLALTMTGHVFAQDASSDELAGSEAETSPVDLEEEDAVDESNVAEDSVDESNDAASAETAEAPPKGNVQLLVGARYRMMVIPKGLINLFGVDGGRTVVRHGVGGEVGGYFGKAADGFLAMGSVWWLGYGLEPTPFKGKNDPDEAWEVAESSMGALYITMDAMWDHKIVDRFSFNVGAGFGLGIVTGKLSRNEAYRDPTNPEIPADAKKGWPDLSRCQYAGDPQAGPYAGDCEVGGEYGPSTKWPVYPWINFQLGLRYQPVDQFVARFDMGIGSSGVWFGLGADYSLFL